ncbi:MAG: zinc ribbon domain-containing protein [Oscillospiraceae bacterium]|nr:zinc ribbon domain-containing protein [Oscillospiraceae bacterium]
MENLRLMAGEAVLIQTTDAGLYSGDHEIDIDELYLTNQNLIYIYEKSTGFFKSETVVQKIPLTSIAVTNGVAQVDIVNDEDYGKSLQLVYSDGRRELLELNVSPKKQYPVWKAAISDAVLCLIKSKPAQQTTNTRDYVFCTNCGEKIGINDKFCSLCGAPTNIDLMPSQQDVTQNDPPLGGDKGASKSFFEESGTYRLTVAEKRFTLRKNYIISDSNGNEMYTAKSEGLPNIPEIGIYKGEKRVGRVAKEWFANPILGNPTYTIHWNNKCIGSLLQKFSLKLKFEIPENGWKVDIGVMKSTVYDDSGSVAVQIKYLMSTGKPSFIVEYTNKGNESPAILLALVAIMACHMG